MLLIFLLLPKQFPLYHYIVFLIYFIGLLKMSYVEIVKKWPHNIERILVLMVVAFSYKMLDLVKVSFDILIRCSKKSNTLKRPSFLNCLGWVFVSVGYFSDGLDC
jgi:hypothetical protein